MWRPESGFDWPGHLLLSIPPASLAPVMFLVPPPGCLLFQIPSRSTSWLIDHLTKEAFFQTNKQTKKHALNFYFYFIVCFCVCSALQDQKRALGFPGAKLQVVGALGESVPTEPPLQLPKRPSWAACRDKLLTASSLHCEPQLLLYPNALGAHQTKVGSCGILKNAWICGWELAPPSIGVGIGV